MLDRVVTPIGLVGIAANGMAGFAWFTNLGKAL